MDLVVALFLQVVYGIAHLVLISLGLAIIFGMMRVINLAHGEFPMLGGYTVVVSTNHGVNLWIAMLILAPLVVGIIGIIVERALIQFLYGRMVDTLPATWGLIPSSIDDNPFDVIAGLDPAIHSTGISIGYADGMDARLGGRTRTASL